VDRVEQERFTVRTIIEEVQNLMDRATAGFD